MPNFDGTGPLKRGRVIGRGLGACKKSTVCNVCNRNAETNNNDEKPATE
jgi:Family of unknown function (DUF5320)